MPNQVVDPLEEVRQRRLIINRLDAWLYEEIEPYLGRRVLEVGSGHGNLIQRGQWPTNWSWLVLSSKSSST